MKRIFKWFIHLNNYMKVKKICNKYGIKNWSIRKDGLIDVDGNVNLKFKSLEKFPLNFGKVDGDFSCFNNKLTSLEGVPEETSGGFYCYNNLTTLEGAPKKVGGGFYCTGNNLTSLEGTPEKIDGNFYCFQNELINLEGCPKEISGDFFCFENNLISLKGGPKEVGGIFYCRDNNLTSLEGAPKEVNNNFYCNGNKLIALEGIPFDIKYLYCSGNPIYAIWKFIDDVEYLEEFVEVYDVVRPGKVVILEYLNDIRKLMGKEPVKREEIPDDWKILDI